ncbi:acyl transferase/acyl hydrolase/lysophospholipase [Neohortaea acidophila]|uniref:Lysophospholipase n=1 Tax=Neohortaea acidophila TaxID=245834 RepID=A0A6A6PT24_9PEZI|nr:acyl transferase/acyl hydrolase/lysophospholipase [Neohortaea acidophila]KAF2482831.1 acyl transferase/acyl hydrolase/lysophospholipase [Neohortaea acidophila]
MTRNIIRGQVFQKALAGYPISYVDLFGRFESYSFLSAEGAPASHFEDITAQPIFQTFHSPFPMIAAGGVNAFGDSCPLSNLSDPAYEFNPYEFGSWEKGISAFVNITYLGSQPYTGAGTCVTGYDNTGFAIATSGNVLGLNCTEFNAKLPTIFAEYNVSHQLAELLFPSNRSLFARYPNPFYNSSSSPKVSEYPNINMVDGGLVSDVAITPLLYRDVDVLFVSDNSGETTDGYVNGTNLHGTYLRAQLNNLTRMPPVPDPPTFVQHGFGNRNVFFGCNTTDTITLVYMPNRDVVYPSNYGRTPDPMGDEVLYGLLDDGRAIASNNRTADWAECVGCAIMGKMAGTLPNFCGACFRKYCAVW